LRRALTGDIVQSPGVSKTLSESLMGFERPIPNHIELNLAISHEFQDDGRSALFRLRKGVRWSDGHPFTVDDILFYYEDMVLDTNARQGLAPPSDWVVGGKPVKMQKVDDWTLRIVASKPLGPILQALCSDVIAYPRHVLSLWHPKYNPKASYEDFRQRTTRAMLLMSPGIPVLTAWVCTNWVRGQYLLYERNPYYWKVDAAGQQLPYADALRFTIVRDPQVILLKFINGEIDLFGRYSRNDMFQTLKTEERKGRFRLHICGPGEGPAFYLNWDCPKPLLRSAFRNKQVRMALSYGITREEVNSTLYKGLLEPSGYTVGPLNDYFSPEAYQRYARYDPAKAGQLLDAAGYVYRDGDGWRDMEDGSPFSFTVDVVMPSLWHDVVSLVAEQWQALGLKVVVNGSLRDIIWPRRDNGTFDVHFWTMEGPDDPLSSLGDWAITGPGNPFWHRFAQQDGPEWLIESTRAFETARTTRDSVQVRKAMEYARDLHTENVSAIVFGFVYHVWGASTRLGNVPVEGTTSGVYRGWSRPVFHEQIYIKK
jgi:peptide/nickel transport system substrate-binding protein